MRIVKTKKNNNSYYKDKEFLELGVIPINKDKKYLTVIHIGLTLINLLILTIFLIKVD